MAGARTPESRCAFILFILHGAILHGGPPETFCRSDATIINMRFGLPLAASLLCLGALAQQTLSIDKLVEFLQSSIRMKMPDKQVAAYVSKMHLSQKLEDR